MTGTHGRTEALPDETPSDETSDETSSRSGQRTVGIRALKQNASAVVAAAGAGDTITITDRGRPVAQITPLPTSRLEHLLELGMARPARNDIRDLDPPDEGPPLSAALEAMRAEERF